LFGKNLTLPVDVLLGTNQSGDLDEPLQGRINAYEEHLRYSYDKTGERTHDLVEYRKTVHDHKRLNPDFSL
jgi:hypothetical protein